MAASASASLIVQLMNYNDFTAQARVLNLASEAKVPKLLAGLRYLLPILK
jgi:hypothetical protein